VCDAELSRITELTNESNASLCNGESNGSVCNGFSTDVAGQCDDAPNSTNSSSSSIASKSSSNSNSDKQQQQQQSALDNSGLCDISNDVSSDVFDYRLHTAAASASDSNPSALNSSNSDFVFNNSSSSISNISNVATDTTQQQQQQQQRNLFNAATSTTGTATGVERNDEWLADHEQFALAVLNRVSELETAMTDLSDVTATSTRGSLTVNGMSLKAIMSSAAAAAHGLSSATAVTTASSGSSSCTQIAGLQPVVLHLLTVAQGLAVHLVEAERALNFKKLNMQSDVNTATAGTAATAAPIAAAAGAVNGDTEGQQQHTTVQLHTVNASDTSHWSSSYNAHTAAAAAAVEHVSGSNSSSSGSSGGVSRSMHSSSSGSSGKSYAVSEHTAASSSSSYGLHCDEWSDALNSVERLLYPYATNTTATTNTTASTTVSATANTAAVSSTSAVYSADKYNSSSSFKDLSSNSVYGTPQQQRQQQQQQYQYSSSQYSNGDRSSTIDSGVHTDERYAVHTVTPDRDLFAFGAATSNIAVDITGSDKQQQQYSAYADTSTNSNGSYDKNGYQNSTYSDDLYNEQHMVMLKERVSALQDRVHRVELDVDDRTTVAQRLSAAVEAPTVATTTAAVAAGAVVNSSGSANEQQLRQLQQWQSHTQANELVKERSAPASVRYIPHEEGDSCIMQPKSVLLCAPYKSPDYPLRNTAAAATAAATVAAAVVVPDENTNSYDQQQQHLEYYNSSSNNNYIAGSVQQQWSAGKHNGSVGATSSSNGVKVTPDMRRHRAPLGEWYMPVSSTG
jgi:hypothetical protein